VATYNKYKKGGEPKNPKNNEFATNKPGDFDPYSSPYGDTTLASMFSRGGVISEKTARKIDDNSISSRSLDVAEGLASLYVGVRDTIKKLKKPDPEVAELKRQNSMLGSMPGSYSDFRSVKYIPEKKLGPFELVNAYHRDTIDKKAAATDREGRPVTVNATGIDVNGRIYMVPGYDRETGKIYTDSEEDQKALKEIYTPLINKGVIPSVAPTAWDGDPREHPANIAAQENHSMMDAQADEALAAVNPDFAYFEDYKLPPNIGAMSAR
jgi:hypothetical protein